MARQEADREDLMREAVALRERMELEVCGETASVVVGLRAEGRLSVYFGGDAAYQFDAEGRLRRAFVEGCLYRSQGGTLARLTRVRTETETQLQRRDLDAAELDEFLNQVRVRLGRLEATFRDPAAHVVAMIPADVNVRSRLAAGLARAVQPGPRLAPPIKGKRSP